MKKLYIDIDGVLLTAKETRPADFVLQFIDYIISNFECYWLTTHCKGDCNQTLLHLSDYFDESTIEKLRIVKATNWTTLKMKQSILIQISTGLTIILFVQKLRFWMI